MPWRLRSLTPTTTLILLRAAAAAIFEISGPGSSMAERASFSNQGLPSIGFMIQFQYG